MTKRQRLEVNPLLGSKDTLVYLPPSIVHDILKFCDFAGLINVASCSTTLNEFVFDDSRNDFWKFLNFAEIPAKWAERISDQELDALLRKINARENCSVLRLDRCRRIRGNGLEPLRGSRSLRIVDLRLVHPYEREKYEHVEVDLDRVLPILNSMPPFEQDEEAAEIGENSRADSNVLGLSRVLFHAENEAGSNYYQVFSERIGSWLWHFHESLRDRACAIGLQCDYCKSSIIDKYPLEMLKVVSMRSFCEECFRYSCQIGECPYTSSCMKCGWQCCQEQYTGPDSKLKPCVARDDKSVVACTNCDVLVCFECDEGGRCCGHAGNEPCVVYYCENCWESQMEECTFCVQNDKHPDDAYCKGPHIADHRKNCKFDPLNATTCKPVSGGSGDGDK